MKNRTITGIALAIIGAITSTASFAAYKCATKDGVTYQDKPCAGSPQNLDTTVVSSERERRLERQLVPTVAIERGPDRVKLDPRKEEQLAEQRDWQDRAARKASLLKVCAMGEARCSPTVLRSAAIYLPEAQLEDVLGMPSARVTNGVGRTSRWSVLLNDDGRERNVTLTAAWGLCSDEKSYFAAGSGARACRVSID